MATDSIRALADNADIRRGILLVVAATLLWASSDVMVKLLVRDYAIVQVLWVRYVVFFGFALVLAGRRFGRRLFATQMPKAQLGRGLLTLGNNVLVIYAFSLMPLADVAAILAVGPLIVTALSVPFLGETVGPRRWAAVAVGFAGVLLILRPGFGVFDPVALAPLAGAVFFAGYQLLTRVVGRVDAPPTSLLYMSAIGLAGSSLVVPFHWTTPAVAADWGLFAAAAGISVVAHGLFIKALTLAPASAVQPFNYCVLAWSIPMGWLVFAQFPDAPTLAGAAVVVASGLYTFHRERVRAAHAR